MRFSESIRQATLSTSSKPTGCFTSEADSCCPSCSFPRRANEGLVCFFSDLPSASSIRLIFFCPRNEINLAASRKLFSVIVGASCPVLADPRIRLQGFPLVVWRFVRPRLERITRQSAELSMYVLLVSTYTDR